MTLDRTERVTLVLSAGYLAAFAVAFVVDEMLVWLVWAIVMVVLVGAVMVAFNRSTAVE